MDSISGLAGSLAQLVQVDMEAAASAISLLLQDPLLRRRMGEAAAQRSQERFECSVINKSYQDLFNLLTEERLRASGDPAFMSSSLRPSWQAHDPVSLFDGFSNGKADPANKGLMPPLPVRQWRQVWSFCVGRPAGSIMNSCS